MFFFINKFCEIPFDICFKVNGLKLYANKPDRILALLLWKFKILESKEIKFLKKIIKKNMIVVDVGANVGLYTSILSKLVGSNGKVFSYEPEPNNFRLLKKCKKINELDNVIIESIAIGEKKENTNFYVSKINSGDNRLSSFKQIHSIISVQKDSLDNKLRKQKYIDFIKMDIQGGEYLALLGMKNLIVTNKKLIILSEVDYSMLASANTNLKDFFKFIKLHFPYIYNINSSRNKMNNFNLKKSDNLLKKNNFLNLIFSKKIINF